MTKSQVPLEALGQLPDGTVIMAFEAGDPVLEKPELPQINNIYDVTPSLNIMTRAGLTGSSCENCYTNNIDYNIPGAIAELIDNSIQAVLKQGKEEREIIICLMKKNKKRRCVEQRTAASCVEQIIVHDTGYFTY